MNSMEIERLIDRYGNDIYRFCYKLSRNRYDADDLYQQTFLKAMQLADKIDETRNPKAFLFSVSLNVWKNHIHKAARHERIAPTVPITDLNEEKIGTNYDICNTVINNELYSVVNQIVNSLNAKFRIPILLYYNCDLNIDEIAIICKCPIGTIKSRLYKGRALIKHELEVLGYDHYE